MLLGKFLTGKNSPGNVPPGKIPTIIGRLTIGKPIATKLLFCDIRGSIILQETRNASPETHNNKSKCTYFLYKLCSQMKIIKNHDFDCFVLKNLANNSKLQ